MKESPALQLAGLVKAAKRLVALDREREQILQRYPAIRDQLAQPPHFGGRRKGYKMTAAQRRKMRAAWKRRKARMAKGGK